MFSRASTPGRRALSLLLAAVTGASVLVAAPIGQPRGASAAGGYTAALELFEGDDGQPACVSATSLLGAREGALATLRRQDCGWLDVYVTPAEALAVQIEYRTPAGVVVGTTSTTTGADGTDFFLEMIPGVDWPAGPIDAVAVIDGQDAGSLRVLLNPLAIEATPGQVTYEPDTDITFGGVVAQLDVRGPGAITTTPVQATVSATLYDRDDNALGSVGPVEADAEGAFSVTFPGSVTAGVSATGGHGLRAAFSATYDDITPYVSYDAEPAESGAWVGSADVGVQLFAPPGLPEITASFVSSTGWVKPGEQFPFRVRVGNHTGSAITGTIVTVDAPPSVTFLNAVPLQGSPVTPSNGGTQLTWALATLPSGAENTLVVQAQTASLEGDPEVVWKDLSVTAELTFDGAGDPLVSTTHGPKVIPPAGGYETSRYGDKPFPMVPVDYRDRSHQAANNGEQLSYIVNSPDYTGSTFNLYQEMSFGQLYPFGTVPSSGVEVRGWDYGPGFDFTDRKMDSTCRGTTVGPILETEEGQANADVLALIPPRIVDGWYQLPGDTEYYGGDFPTYAEGAGGIDNACGPLGKGVFDAAQIADPEIDYNEFDSDKDGVVDFFMMMFVGCGGNGASQVQALYCPAPYGDGTFYDNIWPHSSSLESQYTDPETGLRGYISDDQLTDLLGNRQCWTTDAYLIRATCVADGGTGDDSLPVYVRVGPYNVNPETAFDHNSVISHEYGHHLGLPDFYSDDNTYGTWNLMATDRAQNMTVFSKQDLGWVVPQPVQPNSTVDVEGWTEIRTDTGEIHWQTPAGTPYTLSAANGDQNVHNGLSYTAKLPGRVVFESVPSGSYAWYSGRGDQFGCSPTAGHNLDILLDDLADLDPGTPVELSFLSSWDIEWDWDYAFVVASTDGATYEPLESAEGYSTPSSNNPNQQSCLDDHEFGLTGTSGAYQAGEPEVTLARGNAATGSDYSHGAPFITDSYDLTDYAGQEGVRVRLSYFTDEAFQRPGWLIDDLTLTIDGTVAWVDDFETVSDGRLYPGGCSDSGDIATTCTVGWTRVAAGLEAASDHSYYTELRDRVGFDFNGHGQDDRGNGVNWTPGLLIEYTDEAHGYGNNGISMPPAQHYLDSAPSAGADCGAGGAGACDNAAFVPSRPHFSDDNWTDNFSDPSTVSGNWEFTYGCLSLDVVSMSGHTTIGPAALPADLTADVTLTGGAGCAPFTYGRTEGNLAPIPDIQFRPASPRAGDLVTFDGSGSSDDRTLPADLTYAWDLDDDGTFEESGQTASRSFDTEGSHTVHLRVTDADGLDAVTSVIVDVVGVAFDVASVSPACVVGGDTITITGTGFGDVQGLNYPVLAGEQLTTVLSWSPTEVVARVPEGHASGFAGVVMDGVTSNGKWVEVVAADDPDASGLHLDSISPDRGPAGTEVTFTGTGFGDAHGCGEYVAFAGVLIDRSNVVSWTDTQVVATAPEGVTNGFAGVVTNDITSNGLYYYATGGPVHVDSASPNPVNGGAQLTITGTGFGATQGSSRPVLADQDLTDVVSWSDTQVVVTVPVGHPSGYAGVRVDGITSNGVYVRVNNGADPQVRFIDPESGPVGTVVTFDGLRFGDGSGAYDRVVFRDADGNPITATVLEWGENLIRAEVPVGAASGFIGVVRNGNVSNGKYFTVTG